MRYRRMPIEAESPEQLGYATIECNLAESSVSDVILSDYKVEFKNLALAYGDHYGKPELRKLIAEHSGCNLNDVLITAGAASALFIIATSLLQKEDELIVTRPNYATNIETPIAIGCKINFIDLTFENQFALNAADVEKIITPKTKLISVTTPHNPTGTCISAIELQKIIALAEKNNCYVLVDETYRDLTFDKVLPLWSSKSKNVISVSSLSKAFGLPGIRIGWLCTSNADLMELFLSAKEQIFITNSLVDEELAFYFMQQRNELLAEVKKEVNLKFNYLKSWIQQQSFLEWVEPSGGVVAFPRFTDKTINTALFYKKLYSEYKTMVGPGHWFEMQDHYFRLGFGWYKNNEFEKGLERIEKCFKSLN